MGNNENEWLKYKEDGNKAFKLAKYEEAITSYSTALETCKQKDDISTLYKNRSACYLKLKKYEDAINDADKVLKQNGSDVKALFRRCQANEALGKLEPAFIDIKRLIQLEPRNTAIQEAFRRIRLNAQEKLSKTQSTSGMINDMMESLASKTETPERKKQALSNLVIYSHQSGGRHVLFKEGYLEKLIVLLSGDVENSISLMKILHGFCENNLQQSLAVLKIFPVSKLQHAVLEYPSNIDHTTNTLSVVAVILKAMIEHFKELHKLKPEQEGKYVFVKESQDKVKADVEKIPSYLTLLQLLVSFLSDKALTAEGRDAVVDAFIKAIGYHKCVGDFIIVNKGVRKLLELAALSCFPMINEAAPLPVTEKTYIHVSVALSLIFEYIQYREKEKDKFVEQVESIVNSLIDSKNFTVNLQGLVALSTVILSSRETGQTLATKNDNISKVMVLACREESVAKRLAGEVLALAATDKTVCNSIAELGLEILKKLYQSSDHSIRVRGLVALCKVCMKGSGSVRDQILVDDGAEKLYQACRKFLMSTSKEFELKKWACEGLAYLTLDADVKELLVDDTVALNTLLDLAKSDDTTVMYGICNALVNMTNSYDKPDRNPELEEIAKFAKQPLPQAHEKDAEEFVTKRVTKLIEHGLVTALVNFKNVRSDTTKEMIARIFSAVATDVSLRGKIIAQGGVKTLLPFALSGTEKGEDLASQALARIAITNDPRLAFTGQRCMEVVRPFVKMLHFRREPLLRFEGLMALTNLASMNDDVRRRIMKEKGFEEIEALMFEEDDDLRRAATECMCNLVLNEQAFNRFKDKTSPTERVKLITLYCGEDPPELARAAAGTLAILTSDTEICKMVVEIKSHLEILKFLLTSKNLELRHRGLFIVANLLESEKEIAAKLIEDELFEVLLALKATVTQENLSNELNRCFNAAEKWKIIQENPGQ